ncbi:hypothetical protein [Celeribacter indicus]|uniref:Secreted protein n=1 Tax=Celeribacter indicus TaxID=1208324 RepID=A0A0B5DVN0_9RHOB|nr:hypothetical protein [Celeribacter indicus]AJE44821.1 hypothetical protein P73_0106 [Celeribacter indicus]SDX24250.1 hypothetical protein SAMN05443573_11874 [Celeribacter indicus]
MSRLSVILLLLIVLPSIARAAETIRIASGEHADFSRLVMQFPETVEWVVGRTGHGYVFQVAQEEFEFDVGEVFARIPRTRISEVTPKGDGLVIETAEGFHADAFELRAGRIVIDIKDGPPPPGSPYERPLPDGDDGGGTDPVPTALSPEEPDAPSPQPLLTGGSGHSSLGGPDGAGSDLVGTDPPDFPLLFDKASPAQSLSGERSAGLALPDDDQQERADRLERQLVEQIGRAVAQGLLDADVSATEDALEAASSHRQDDPPSRPDRRPMPVDPPPPEPQEPESHVRIQTSVDEAQGRSAPAVSTDRNGTSCIPDEAVDIASWGDPPENGLKLSEFRSRLIGEFDTPDPEAVERLARYYLFLTFGAEAKSVLRNFDVPIHNRDILLAMAEIMDQGESTLSRRLGGQFRCAGMVAFWSVMSKEPLNSWESYNQEAVQSTFSALPGHIRRHLGPTLSERFLRIGDEASAEFIQEATLRSGGDHRDAFDLLEAEFQLAEGRKAQAQQSFERVVAGDGPKSAEALIRLIETRSRLGEPIDGRDAEHAEALTVEHRGSAMEHGLRRAAILARSGSGDADIALRAALALPAEDAKAEDERDALISSALLQLAATKPDGVFLRIVSPELDRLADAGLSDPARLKTAERLVSLGFDREALRLMSGYGGQESGAAPLVMAQAFLGIGEFEAAERYASRADTPDASEIRAFALSALGRAQEAADAFPADISGQWADAFALLAEDWPRLRQTGSADLSTLADAVQHAAKVETPLPTLSEAQTLLDRSREVRQALSAVLQQP